MKPRSSQPLRWVFLHGFTGAPSSWDSLRSRLDAGAIEASVPELLGHGAPDEADDGRLGSFEREIDRIARVLRGEAAEFDRVVGYSLGGRLAVGLLIRHPKLFRAATLIGCSAGLETDEERVDRRAADRRWVEMLEREPEAFHERWQSLPLFESQRRRPRRDLERQSQVRRSHTPEGLALSLERVGLGEMPNYRERLAEVPVPVDLVVGELDLKFHALARDLEPRFARARVLVAPDCGHNVVLEGEDWLFTTLSRSAVEDRSRRQDADGLAATVV